MPREPGVGGWTRLHAACESGDVAAVKAQLKGGADKDAADEDGWTPLYAASGSGHVEVVKVLLDNGANKEASVIKDGWTPLFAASYNGHVEVVKVLLEKGANTEAYDKDGQTPLHAASCGGHMEVVKVLLEKGANKEAADESGSTPLGVAASLGHKEVVKVLLEAGANRDVADEDEVWTCADTATCDTKVNAILDDGLGQLRGLTIQGELPSLPDSFTELTTLTSLDLSRCTRLALDLAKAIAPLTGLVVLNLRGVEKAAGALSALAPLTNLEELALAGCTRLTENPTGAKLRTLDVQDCYRLSLNYDDLHGMANLNNLLLGGCQVGGELTSWPTALVYLQLPRIDTLPAKVLPPGLNVLDARFCRAGFNLPILDPAFGGLARQLSALTWLGLSYKAEQRLRQDWSRLTLQPVPRFPKCVSANEERILLNPGHGDGDAADRSDKLGVEPIVKGCAKYLRHPGTMPLVMAVYGPWGTGKSSFMKQLEAELRRGFIPGSEAGRKSVMTVWFNAWQYLTEQQVWAGLVVEVVKGLEEDLTLGQRLLLAWWYNWIEHRTAVIMKVIVPTVMVLIIVVVLMWFGIKELGVLGGSSEDTMRIAALKGAVGIIGTLVVVGTLVSTTNATVKSISEALVAKISMLQLPDHKDKIGYQNAVIADLTLMLRLLPGVLGVWDDFKGRTPWVVPCTICLAKFCAMLLRGILVVCKAALLVFCCRLFCGVDAIILTRAVKSKVSRQSRRIVPVVESDRDEQHNRHRSSEPPIADGAAGGDKLRIFVFIDDLDRCKPSKVVEVLEAINIVLNGSKFFVVVGMDKSFIHNAIRTAYKDNNNTRTMKWAEVFLQKIVQVSITLVRSHGVQVWKLLSSNIYKVTTGLDRPAQVMMQRAGEDAVPPSPGARRPVTRLDLSNTTAVHPAASSHVTACPTAIPNGSSDSGSPDASHVAGSLPARRNEGSPLAMPNAKDPPNRPDAPAASSHVTARPAAIPDGNSDSGSPDASHVAGSLPANIPAPGVERKLHVNYFTLQAVEGLKKRVAHYYDNDPTMGQNQFSEEEQEDFKRYYQLRLLDNVGPREVKRLLNHYRLLKYILLEDDGIDFDHRPSLAWTILWWRWPHVMERFMKVVHESETNDGNVKDWMEQVLKGTTHREQRNPTMEQQEWRQLRDLLETLKKNELEPTFDSVTFGIARKFSMYRVGLELVPEDDSAASNTEAMDPRPSSRPFNTRARASLPQA